MIFRTLFLFTTFCDAHSGDDGGNDDDWNHNVDGNVNTGYVRQTSDVVPEIGTNRDLEKKTSHV